VFTDNDIARMVEVQFVSDLVMNLREGLQDFSARRLDAYYARHEDTFSGARAMKRRLDALFDQLVELGPETLASSIFVHKRSRCPGSVHADGGESHCPVAARVRRVHYGQHAPHTLPEAASHRDSRLFLVPHAGCSDLTRLAAVDCPNDRASVARWLLGRARSSAPQARRGDFNGPSLHATGEHRSIGRGKVAVRSDVHRRYTPPPPGTSGAIGSSCVLVDVNSWPGASA
jgi:hypothetical protein